MLCYCSIFVYGKQYTCNPLAPQTRKCRLDGSVSILKYACICGHSSMCCYLMKAKSKCTVFFFFQLILLLITIFVDFLRVLHPRVFACK